jgi:inward rectifier potassium channel
VVEVPPSKSLFESLVQRVAQDRGRIVRIGGREIISTGLNTGVWSDLYHRCMTASWTTFFGGVLLVFLLLNGFFALLFALGDNPIANLPPEHPFYLVYFSIETLSTVGYGEMYPQTHYGHVVASTEMFSGLVYAAVMTGLIFARFSRPRARLVFARTIVIGQHEGRRTLMIRVANARHNTISDASARLWLIRSEVTSEGQSYRRFHELKLERNQNPIFVLSWTIFHCIDDKSPLFNQTAADLAALEASFVLSVQGHDENFASLVNDRWTYAFSDIYWNHRYVDIIEGEPGTVRLNYRRFHDVVPE